jgi:hypothetical protein
MVAVFPFTTPPVPLPAYQVKVYPAVIPPTFAEACPFEAVPSQLVWLTVAVVITGATLLLFTVTVAFADGHLVVLFTATTV